MVLDHRKCVQFSKLNNQLCSDEQKYLSLFSVKWGKIWKQRK